MSFFKDFFFLDLGDYENFGTSFPLGIFLIILTVALSLSVFIITYHNIYITTLLKRLIRFGATSQKNAKTLAELGLDKVHALRYALSHSGQLTFMVKRAGVNEISYEEYVEKSKSKSYCEEKIDFNEARFYISEDKLDRAKKTVETNSTSWFKPAVLSAVFFAILILFAVFSEEILTFFNNAAK